MRCNINKAFSANWKTGVFVQELSAAIAPNQLGSLALCLLTAAPSAQPRLPQLRAFGPDAAHSGCPTKRAEAKDSVESQQLGQRLVGVFLDGRVRSLGLHYPFSGGAYVPPPGVFNTLVN